MKSITSGTSNSEWCFTCGNKGFVDKVCPSCGRPAIKISMGLEDAEESDKFLTKIDAFGIPGKYRGVTWNKDILTKSKPNLANDYNFTHFVSQLDKVFTLFAEGKLTPKSAIIIAPAGFSKMVFAYSCMQFALEHELSVAPLLDTVELKRLLVLSAERPTYKLYDSINYDSYIMSDVCFITVTKLKQREYAYEVIQEIIDRRTRKGLSTFILSRYDLAEISRRDVSNDFEAITSNLVEDTFKYPAIIRYRQCYTPQEEGR